MDGELREPFLGLDLVGLLATPPEPIEWIWRGWIARSDTVLAAGDSGVGKSIVKLAVSLQDEVLGEPVDAAPTVYLDLENTLDVVRDRVRALGADNADRVIYVHRPAGFNLQRRDSFGQLAATVETFQPRHVVIDSSRRAAPALDENDSKAVSTLMTRLRGLAAEHGCAITIVHHPRKPLGDVPIDGLHAARGSGDLVASVDTLLFFRRLKGGLVRIEHAKARRGHPHEPVHYRIVENDAGGPELQLVDVERTNADELDAAVLAYVSEHPGESTNRVREGVKKRREIVEASLGRLVRAERLYSRSSADLGRTGKGTYWFPSNHAGSDSSGLNGTSRDEPSARVVQEGDLSHLSVPRRGDKSPDEPLIEELSWR